MNKNTIPMAPSGWNSADPSGSFRAFAESIHSMARETFLKDKSHAEMVFFMPLNGQGHIVLTRFDDRDAMAQWMKKQIEKHYVFGVVHIVEAWVRLAEGTNDHILQQVINGEIRVSELREEDRKEALTVSAQARDGYSINWIDEIVRDKTTGSLSLQPSIIFRDFEGRFGKLFG